MSYNVIDLGNMLVWSLTWQWGLELRVSRLISLYYCISSLPLDRQSDGTIRRSQAAGHHSRSRQINGLSLITPGRGKVLQIDRSIKCDLSNMCSYKDEGN